MREGVRDSVARGRVSTATGWSMLTLIAAGAFTPFLQGLSAQGVTDLLGGLGVNYLSAWWVARAERLRRDGSDAGAFEALAEELERDLAKSAELRAEVTALLSRIGGLEVALTTAYETGRLELLGGLAATTEEVRGLLVGASGTLAEIGTALREQVAGERQVTAPVPAARSAAPPIPVVTKGANAPPHNTPSSTGGDHSRTRPPASPVSRATRSRTPARINSGPRPSPSLCIPQYHRASPPPAPDTPEGNTHLTPLPDPNGRAFSCRVPYLGDRYGGDPLGAQAAARSSRLDASLRLPLCGRRLGCSSRPTVNAMSSPPPQRASGRS
ncbi:hypothetical protein [Actinomadura terrae]|uniref:hypothetical protein n=1 Tax=Actinomadura terrae TaxID=604353 RepID=UPI001FA6CFDC|nr:hypothetical protein [Actinomadura terrae]